MKSNIYTASGLKKSALHLLQTFFMTLLYCWINTQVGFAQAGGPLTATTDPNCTSKCCEYANPCNCSAGVIVTGGVPPYSILIFNGTNIIGVGNCKGGLCPGTYDFHIRDSKQPQPSDIVYSVTIGGPCCKLNCRDTAFCYNLPDSAIHLKKPTYTTSDLTGGASPCFYDSIWNNAPGVYPVGTTVVTWYALKNGLLDSCTSNIIRNPPSVYNICFTTSPAIVGGVINICNGQSINFNANCSSGITGLLWNFGNGYYSGNSVHTEPSSHYPPGTYYDTLTVYDDCGVGHDTAFTVVVDSSAGPDIYCLSVQCPGDTVTYKTHASCTGYTWSVFGGAFLFPPSPTSDSCVIVWGTGPLGYITLLVTGCTPPLTCPLGTTVTVHIVPATLPVRGDTVVCSGGMTCYSIECIPGNTHSWEMLPANAGVITGSNTCEVCIKWDTAFFGYVTLQVNYQNILTGSGCNLMDGCDNDPGCGGTGTITIHVKPNFGIVGPQKVCPNTVASPSFNGMNLTNNTIAPGVSWKLLTSVPSTLTFGNSALLNAYLWNNGPGIYTLTAYPPLGVYCNDSATVNVEVVDMLTPNPITGLDTVCTGDTTYYATAPNMQGVTYNWTVTNGTIVGPATGSSIAVVWNAGGGNITVSQSLTASPFCASPSVTSIVKTWPNFVMPVITPSAINPCVKSTITYSIPPTLLSNATYTWSIVPATAGNIITANGTNTITIYWLNGSPPPSVKLKISRCYEDSVMLPVNLQALPPVPNISYAPLNPCKNTIVNFSTTSIQPSYKWLFGDGDSALVQNTSHIYTTAGTFNVMLIVTNANGCSDTAQTPVTIEDVPVVPVVTGGASVCVNAPTSYTFSQPLFMGANYTWSLSAPALGGITSSGNNFMNVLWSIPGVDTVKLHIQSTCLDTIIKFVVTVHANPTPGITLPSPACEGSPLTFNGSGGPGYSWIFSGGAPSSSAVASPVVTYAAANTYPVSLTVTDVFGCTATALSSITVNPLPLAVITGPSSVCAPYPKTVTYSAINIGGYTYAWTPSGSGPSITQTINAQTTFSVVVTNIYSCTRTSNSITVDTITCNADTANCIPFDTINFTYTPPVCLTQTYTKTGTATLTGWNFGGPTSPISNTYPFPGIYTVTVYGSSPGIDSLGNPCVAPVAHQKQVTIPFDGKFEFSYQCNGSNQMTTVFNNTSLYLGNATSYNWLWYDGATLLSSVAFPPAQILSSGPHTINLYIFDPITLATCTVSHNINVPLPIVAAFTVGTPVCQGSPATFTDVSINVANEVSRLFNNGNFATSTASPANLVYINSGLFTATLNVTDKYGCTSSASQLVTANPQATGTITVTPGCDSVQLFSSGAGPFTWNIISPPPSPPNPVYVKTSGYYSVTSVDGNGCPFTVGPVNVTVQKSPNATITGQTIYCQGENLDIKTTAAGTSFAWILVGPNTPAGNTANCTALAGFGVPGTYTYQVSVVGLNGCTATAQYVITVDPVPASASIVGGPLTFCDGDSIALTVNPPAATYLWSKSPSPFLTSPADVNDTLYVTVSGTYSVIAQTINGCAYPAIAPVTVTVNPTPPANITGDTTVCEGEILVLKSTPVGGGTYSWNGNYGTQTTNPYVATNIQLADAGLYTVVVTNSFGCTNTDSITVIVNPTPLPPVVAPPGPFCEGTLHQLCVQSPPYGPLAYLWNTGQNGYCINAIKAGDYSVVATNVFGCSALSNIVSIHPLPDLSCVPTGCYDFCTECDTVQIPGPFNLATYDWQQLIAGNWINYTYTQNLPVVPPGGIFRLVGYNQFGCSDSTDTLKIDFHDCCPPIDSSACIDTCLNFNNVSLAGWGPHPSAPNVNVVMDNFTSQGGLTDYYIKATDQPGSSQLLAGPQFNGKWCCGTFCFDYRLFQDGVSSNPNVNPVFTIFNGTLGFRFTSSTLANETNGWHRVCAPVNDCAFPVSSTSGTWTPIAGTVVADWVTVINNVTEVVFKVDYTTSDIEISNFDNVCLTPNVPDIDAGADQTICKGDVAILHVNGCTGIPQWYQINGNVNVFVANGTDIDVTPTVTTCYMVICCNEGTTCCCDTDTVCVIVNPLPVLTWPTIYPNVCLNSAPIYLDTLAINAIPAGGTGVFAGPFVIGNYFFPNAVGLYTIAYCYTDTNGCKACVSNTINVIDCSDSCQISAGKDTTICKKESAILHVTGCDSLAHWYQISPTGNVLIGIGDFVEVTPIHSTCYMVICCCPGTTSCDTDTVCVNVNPLPVLLWPISYSNVCLNSDSIFLNANNVYVMINNIPVPITSTGGTWTWNGIGVVGNYFYPNTLGTHVITLCYTDIYGCTACISNIITVIPCCGDSTCMVNAGNDTTICQGNVAILQATGCDSIPRWYSLGTAVTGFTYIGQGEVIDVMPQHTTCYAVICCCPGTACCDTDTVCVYVNPSPILTWTSVYPNACLNSAPIYLDTLSITAIPPGGTGVFSGPNVIGYYFFPNTLGPNTITYTYVDPNGCTASVSNTINVIVCCDSTTCHVDLGSDTTICEGGVVILTAQGCSGTTTWYKLTAIGPIAVGQGPILDVFPQESTCYVAVCCCVVAGTQCCTSDTICVNVNPHPVLTWTSVYPNACLNSAPIYLDTLSITAIPPGGTGVFSGPNVIGYYFFPNTLGPNTITYTYVDPNGCTASVSNTINVIVCCDSTICNDNDLCTIDICDPATGQCLHILINYNDNNACTLDGCDPLTGPYHIPVIIDDGNACTEDYCDPLTGEITHTAININDGNACTEDYCNPQTGEITHTAISCDDGNACTIDACDPAIGCYYASLNYNDNNECTVDGCDPITGPYHIPVIVDDGNACTEDYCDPLTGEITHTAININDGNACTEDYCNPQTGEITHTAISCDDGNACTIDACDPAIGCYYASINYDDGNPCTEDGCDPITGVYHHIIIFDDQNPCTIDGCDPVTGPYHIPVNVDDGNPCTLDRCNPETGEITHTPINVSDGNACTEDYCNPQTGEITHTAISCDDGNACTIDACDPAIGCYYASLNYNDNNECTVDGCDPITGPYHIPVIVDDGNACTEDYCDPLTGEITHTAININDGNACTEDYCNPQTGEITHTAISCDDGNACTIDACDPAIGCYYASINYDDGNPCTEDGCDPITGVYHHIIIFDDQNPCTIDGCDPVTGPYHIPVNVDDGNPCTLDRCNPETGEITHTPINVSDGNACTEDYCNPQTGEIIHTAISCDDGNACTIDACDPAIGCYYASINYDDGNPCTEDGCDPITGVYHHIIIFDDQNPCTIDGCDPVTGPYHIPVNVDDGNPCTSDACDPLTGTIVHNSIDCNDNNPCTIEVCDPATGQCIYSSINYDDGNPCTVDGCDPVSGVYHYPKIVDDGNACTEDYCNPQTGEITHIAISCDDNNRCTIDACDPATGQCYYASVNTDDQNACTEDGCDPVNGVYHTAINCNDNNPCTLDGCDPVSGCYHINIVLNPVTIIGTPKLCVTNGQITGLFSIAAQPAGTTISWSVPSGLTIISGQGTNQILVSWTIAAAHNGISGPLCVTISNPCGSAITCVNVDIQTTKPVTPNSISGTAKICPGDTVVYSVAPVSRATSYLWTVPAGVTIISGQGTNIITVVVGNTFIGGQLTVSASNSCGTSPVRTRNLSLNPPLTPGLISGQVNGVCGGNFNYSIAPVPGATSYLWTLTGSGASIVGSPNGLSVNVSFSSSVVSVTLSVVAINGCGTSAPRVVNITGAPALPGPINGPTTLCLFSTYPYSVTTVPGTVTYTWTTPAGTLVGQGTKNITYTPSGLVPASTYVITVRATNACGNSAVRSLSNITIAGCPRIGDVTTTMAGLQVYPNPVHDLLNVEFEVPDAEHFSLQLFDLAGRVVMHEEGSGTGDVELKLMDVSKLAEGSYIIQLKTLQGVSQLKVIVE